MQLSKILWILRTMWRERAHTCTNTFISEVFVASAAAVAGGVAVVVVAIFTLFDHVLPFALHARQL